MHEIAFSHAVYPAPTRILGLTLKPYSIGHELHLLRESNPLLSGVAANVKREDLAQAVLICSLTFDERRGMASDWLLPLKLWGWKRRQRKLPLDPHVQGFLEYRAAGSISFPASNTPRADRGSGRLCGAPFLLRLYQFVLIQLREPVGRAWDYPLGLAQMQFATYWEEQGGFDIYNEHDAEHDRAVRELDALEASKGKR